MEQRKKEALYSEEFQAMLDKIDEEDYAERSWEAAGNMRSKSRLCIQQAKALEKHFEEENKLQPERKVKIAQELGLDPRQVAVWFQNRRARSKAKQLEREYDQLRASYAALQDNYGSLELEKQALLSQLKELKAKIDTRSPQRNSTIPSIIQEPLNCNDVSNNESTSLNLPSSASSSFRPTFDPFSMASSSSSVTNEYQLWKAASQNQIARMEQNVMFSYNNEESCNFFSSVDQPPTLHWHQGDQFN